MTDSTFRAPEQPSRAFSSSESSRALMLSPRSYSFRVLGTHFCTISWKQQQLAKLSSCWCSRKARQVRQAADRTCNYPSSPWSFLQLTEQLCVTEIRCQGELATKRPQESAFNQVANIRVRAFHIYNEDGAKGYTHPKKKKIPSLFALSSPPAV